MTKSELLQEIQRLSAKGEISEAELLQSYRAGSGIPAPQKHSYLHLDITKILYGIGGIIVISGLVFLIMQAWDSFGASAQIMVTLGSAIALYISAVLLTQVKQYGNALSLTLFLISAVIMPIGIFVTLYHLSPGDNVWLGQIIIAGLPTTLYFFSYNLYKKPLLLLISLLFFTWTLTAFLGYIMDEANITANLAEIWNYWALAVGVSYILLGYSFAKTNNRQLSSVLYFLGSGASLIAGYALTFIQDPWIIIYFLLILSVIYLSTALRSRILLIFGAMALIAHLTHISFQYFANSLGFPLALIISGFLIIGIGYGSLVINRRFVSR